MSQAVLEVRNLATYFHYHDHVVRAVDGVDFDLDRGETLGIVGESGCGKSVATLSLMQLIPSPPGRIESGEARLDGEDILHLPQSRLRTIRGERMSMIFQEPMTSLNPVFTVGWQISEMLRVHTDMSKAEAMAQSERLLALVGIPDPKDRLRAYPFQLSGGLRQRVMIAMAMSLNPAVLIADEPTTALDVTIQAQILRLMRELRERSDTAIIFITHDLAVIAGFTDRVIVMYAGVVVESAAVRAIFKNPMHPYTRGLLESIPALKGRKRASDGSRVLLNAIPGSLPDARHFPSGCRFASRCSRVMAKCRQAEPELVETAAGHRVRCYLYSDRRRERPRQDHHGR